MGHTVDVSGFGAYPDGSDATSGIQAAIDYAAPLGLGVQLGKGAYRITAPLEMRLDSSHDTGGLSLLGMSLGVDRNHPCRSSLLWDGSTQSEMVRCWSRGVGVEGVHFDVASGKSALCALDVTKGDGAGANTCTDNRFTSLRIAAESGGSFVYGAKLADKIGAGSFPSNCDFFKFDRVYISGATTASVYCPSTTGQAKRHTFRECVFYGSPVGLYYESGSFSTWACNFSLLSNTAIYAHRATDTLGIYESDSEHCARLFSGGNGSAAWNVTISGGRFDAATSLAQDGTYISLANNGALTLLGAHFAAQLPSAFNVKVGSNSLYCGGKLLAIGCTFPTSTPFALSSGVFCQRRSVRGCTYYDSSGEAHPINDEDVGYGLNAGYTLKSPELYRVSNLVHVNPYASGGEAVARSYVGRGSPNGSQVGNVGDDYRDVTGTAGAVYWVKESGTGNTGWVAK